MPGEVWRMVPLDTCQSRPCTACGTPMLMVPGKPRKDGAPTWLPLDLLQLRRVVNEEIPINAAVRRYEAQSHFQTCPQAARFSKR